MQSVLILGRQPALGLAELESLYGAAAVRPVGDHAAVVDVDPCWLAFDRLGGSVKFCKLLTTLDNDNWPAVERFLLKVSPEYSQRMPAGKMRLGLSAIGFRLTPAQLQATGLKLKKAIRATGRSVRVVPNQQLELNAAQVIHNQLTGVNGWELLIIRDGQQTLIAQTVKVQAIDDYTRRDRGRPKRDAKVGMLPPKLAQILINLAVGVLPEDTLKNICDIPADAEVPRPQLGQTIFDPFCGTGVVLQEAALMGYRVMGSDIEPRMIDYTTQNLHWLQTVYRIPSTVYPLEVADATGHDWKMENGKWDTGLAVASEAYLGRPFTARPDAEILARTVAECNLIIKKFLTNVRGQLEAGTRVCLAVPAWSVGGNQESGIKNQDGGSVEGFKTLPLIDSLSDLGYNRVSFEHARDDQLLYYREGQIVGRQILVLTRS